MNTKIKLSTLWILVLLNMLLADVLSIMVELVEGNTLAILGEVKITMAVAAVIINIPLLMIYFSRSLSIKINRILNIVVGVITIVFVVGGGSLLPHYIICAGIEIVILLIIISTAWKWGSSEKSQLSNTISFLLITLLLPACQPNAQPAQKPNKETDLAEVIEPIDQDAKIIATRFNPPNGFVREEVDEHSFAHYLRNFSLKKHGARVYLYNGELKNRQDVHLAVLDIDVGKRDLQQCADAVMRLRAEYLRQEKRYHEITFNFTNGFPAEYQRWRNGQRIKVSGNSVMWTTESSQDTSYASFRRYLIQVFAYAGTLSLEKQLAKKTLDKIAIGDVLIQGGSPGHAVLVVDKVIHPVTGEIAVMLAQSYMPAQEIHVLRNPLMEGDNPWYLISLDPGVSGAAAVNNSIATPEWNFSFEDLREF